MCVPHFMSRCVVPFVSLISVVVHFYGMPSDGVEWSAVYLIQGLTKRRRVDAAALSLAAAFNWCSSIRLRRIAEESGSTADERKDSLLSAISECGRDIGRFLPWGISRHDGVIEIVELVITRWRYINRSCFPVRWIQMWRWRGAKTGE